MTVGEQIAPFLNELTAAISRKNTFYGNRISPTIMGMFQTETRQDGAGLLVPYWVGVTQRGRGPRRSTKDSGLRKTIYKWMEKHGLFKSNTAQGKVNEARFMAMYINKYGNKQFRTKRYIDIYDTERKITIKKIDNQFNLMIGKITEDVI